MLKHSVVIRIEQVFFNVKNKRNKKKKKEKLNKYDVIYFTTINLKSKTN